MTYIKEVLPKELFIILRSEDNSLNGIKVKNIITRIWHGKTKIENADAYFEVLEKTGIKDYKSISGNLSVEIWRRKEKDFCHFWTVTKWDSYESIKRFAGEDFEKAKYYPDDKKYLLEFEEKVLHTETFIF